MITMKNMDLLLPVQAARDTHLWATVTQAAPLRIRVDGEVSALPFTPDTLVAGLQAGDRVWIGFSANDDMRFLGKRVVVMGRSGGSAVGSVIAWRRRESNSPGATSGGSVEVGVLRLDDIAIVAGRGYWVYTPTMTCSANVGVVVGLRLRYNTSGLATVSSTELRFTQTTIRTGTPDEPININEMFRPGSSGNLSVLLSVVNVSASGTAVIQGNATRAIELFVEDRGPIPAMTGTDL